MGFIDHEHVQADAAAQAQSVARDQHNQAIWDAVLDRFWIGDMDCNYNIVLGWCGGKVLTFDAIETLLRSKRKDVTLVPVTPGELADQLVDQMTFKSDWDKKQFRIRLSTYSLKQLRDLARKFRAQAAIKTKEQAREVLKAAGPKPPHFTGWPQLLPKIFLKDVFRYVQTDKYLFELAMKAQHAKGTEGSMAVFELKKYCRLYGADQVNWHLERGRAAAEAEALSNG
jgi:hypothetical protein